MRDRLIDLHTKAHTEWLRKEYDHETDKNIAEYVVDYLIANGVICPPYKVGTRVYVITSKTSNDKNFYIFEDTITHYRIVEGCTIMCFENHLGEPNWKWNNVFLTKEEAEKALRGEGE